MKSTMTRKLQKMRAERSYGGYAAELTIRQIDRAKDEDNLFFLYAICDARGENPFFGVTEQPQFMQILDGLMDADGSGKLPAPAGCVEACDSVEASVVSTFANFYEMAHEMLKNLRDTYEVEAIAAEEGEEDVETSDFNIPTDKEELYRLRLSLETDVVLDSIFHDSDRNSFEYEKQYVKALVASCENEADYTLWKKNFLDEEFRAAKDRDIVVCRYIFNGFGQYEMLLPMEELHPFQGWLQSGGAMDAGMREATDEEVRRYIALNAARK